MKQPSWTVVISGLLTVLFYILVVDSNGQTAYPLHRTGNTRYLTDQNNRPVMLVGDSAWNLIVNLNQNDASTYFANRKARGFNAVMTAVLCGPGAFGRSDFSTYDGIVPFTTPGDISTPNPAYFARVDQMVNLAASYGIMLLLNPIENYGWESIYENSSATKLTNWGMFLGNRYKGSSNIQWFHGNDYQDWPAADTAFLRIINGIKSVDGNHLHTFELNYLNSEDLNDANLSSVLGLNFVYTYFPTYAEGLKAYNRSTMPWILGESNYDQEHLGNVDGGSVENLRRQEYWVATSGAAGQLFGSFWTDRFANGWQNNIDDAGTVQLQLLVNLFNGLQWYNLIPDQNHQFVTAGYGTPYTNFNAGSAVGTIPNDNYVTAALTSDKTLGIAYLPVRSTITVNLGAFSGPVSMQWFDPSSGATQTIGGSPFANSGSKQTAPPGQTSDGQGDWVLICKATSNPTPTPTPVPTPTPTPSPTPTPTATPTPTPTPTPTATPPPTPTPTPGLAPNLISAISSSRGDATLHWTESGSGGWYKVVYGTQSAQYSYPPSNGSDVTWTVSNLTSGTTYFFAVQYIQNGTGAVLGTSNALSVKIQ